MFCQRLAHTQTMLRRVLPRLPLFRVSAPILPISLRSSARPVPAMSLTGSPRSSSSRLFHHVPARLTSTPPPPNDPASQLPPDATLSQRLKHLIKSYGWYALGVYFVLSTLDFTVAFAGISLLGAEQVASAAAYIKEIAIGFIHTKPPEPGRDEMDSIYHPQNTIPTCQSWFDSRFHSSIGGLAAHKRVGGWRGHEESSTRHQG